MPRIYATKDYDPNGLATDEERRLVPAASVAAHNLTSETTNGPSKWINANASHVQSRRESLDPIQFFPAELSLWTTQEILLYSEDYTSQLLDLTSVSREWQHFFLSAPILWSKIYLKATAGDLVATTALFVHLSGTVPLHLFVGYGIRPEWEQQLSNVIATVRNRVVSLFISLLDGQSRLLPLQFDIAMLTRATSAIFASVGRLENLKEIQSEDCITFKIIPTGLRTLDLPQQVHIRNNILLPLCDTSQRSQNFSIFTRVTTPVDLPTTISMLSAFAFVTALTFTDESDGYEEDGYQPLVLITPGFLPRLTSLACHQEYDSNIMRLCRFTAPQLSSLSLRSPLERLPELVELLNITVHLQELRLVITTDYGYMFTSLPPCDSVIPSLRSLSCTTSGIDENWVSDNLRSLRQLFGVFMKLYPGIGSVSFEEFPAVLYCAFFFLQNLGGLHALSLKDCGAETSPKPEVHLPSVTELKVYNPVILRYLRVPNLLRLWISGLILSRQLVGLDIPLIRTLIISPGPQPMLHCTLDALDYKSLQSLYTIVDTRTRFELSPISHLVSITLNTESHGNPQGNLICMALVCYPEHCPSLKELHFNRFVEWDILFNMLERRNFAGKAVQCIQKITLPFIPFPFRMPLARLLRGERTERPSDRYMSLEETRKAVFDFSTQVSTFNH